LRYAIALHERLPRMAAVFARGEIDFRLVAAVVWRTDLVEDPGPDAAVAKHVKWWMRLSERKLTERIDIGWSASTRRVGGCPGSATRIATSRSLPPLPG
jgi:hypothetical protein